jgi:hypothetical protein
LEAARSGDAAQFERAATGAESVARAARRWGRSAVRAPALPEAVPPGLPGLPPVVPGGPALLGERMEDLAVLQGAEGGAGA